MYPRNETKAWVQMLQEATGECRDVFWVDFQVGPSRDWPLKLRHKLFFALSRDSAGKVLAYCNAMSMLRVKHFGAQTMCCFHDQFDKDGPQLQRFIRRAAASVRPLAWLRAYRPSASEYDYAPERPGLQHVRRNQPVIGFEDEKKYLERDK